MPTVDVVDLKKAKVGTVELPKSVFGCEARATLVHEAVVMQRACERLVLVERRTLGVPEHGAKLLERRRPLRHVRDRVRGRPARDDARRARPVGCDRVAGVHHPLTVRVEVLADDGRDRLAIRLVGGATAPVGVVVDRIAAAGGAISGDEIGRAHV